MEGLTDRTVVITSQWMQISHHHIHVVHLNTILSILHTITFVDLTSIKLGVWGKNRGNWGLSIQNSFCGLWHAGFPPRPLLCLWQSWSPMPEAGQHRQRGRWWGHVGTHTARLGQSSRSGAGAHQELVPMGTTNESSREGLFNNFSPIHSCFHICLFRLFLPFSPFLKTI